jgi:hypothetical protein
LLAAFAMGNTGSKDCPTNYDRVTTDAECKSLAAIGGKLYGGSVNLAAFPSGCFYLSVGGAVYLNTNAKGLPEPNAQLMCAGTSTARTATACTDPHTATCHSLRCMSVVGCFDAAVACGGVTCAAERKRPVNLIAGLAAPDPTFTPADSITPHRQQRCMAVLAAPCAWPDEHSSVYIGHARIVRSGKFICYPIIRAHCTLYRRQCHAPDPHDLPV